jgi:hypothetical protein
VYPRLAATREESVNCRPGICSSYVPSVKSDEQGKVGFPRARDAKCRPGGRHTGRPGRFILYRIEKLSLDHCSTPAGTVGEPARWWASERTFALSRGLWPHRLRAFLRSDKKSCHWYIGVTPEIVSPRWLRILDPRYSVRNGNGLRCIGPTSISSPPGIQDCEVVNPDLPVGRYEGDNINGGRYPP